MLRPRRRLLLVLGGLALGACAPAWRSLDLRRSLEPMCRRECQQTERSFEDLEACRSRCREAAASPVR